MWVSICHLVPAADWLTDCHCLLPEGLQTDGLSSSVDLWFENWHSVIICWLVVCKLTVSLSIAWRFAADCHCLLTCGLQTDSVIVCCLKVCKLTVCCHLLTRDLQTDSLSLLPEGLQSVCWLRVCKLSVCHCLCAEGLLTDSLLSSVDGRFHMLSWRTLFRCLPIMGWRWCLALPLAVSVVHTHFCITHLALLSNLLCAQVWVRCSRRDGNVRATLWDRFSCSFQACVLQRCSKDRPQLWNENLASSLCDYMLSVVKKENPQLFVPDHVTSFEMYERLPIFVLDYVTSLVKWVQDRQFLFELCHLSWEMGKRLPIFVPDCATSLAKWVKDCQCLFLVMPPLLWKG